MTYNVYNDMRGDTSSITKDQNMILPEIFKSVISFIPILFHHHHFPPVGGGNTAVNWLLNRQKKNSCYSSASSSSPLQGEWNVFSFLSVIKNLGLIWGNWQCR